MFFFFFNCCVCILLRKYSLDKDIQSILVSKEGQSMLEVWEIRSSGEKFSTGFEQNNIQYQARSFLYANTHVRT